MNIKTKFFLIPKKTRLEIYLHLLKKFDIEIARRFLIKTNHYIFSGSVEVPGFSFIPARELKRYIITINHHKVTTK